MALSTTSLLIFWWISFGLTLLIVGLRMYHKLQALNSIWFTPHDGFLVLTCVLSLVCTALGTRLVIFMDTAVANILRTHPDADPVEKFLTPHQTGEMMKFNYLAYLVITLTLWSTKATLAAIYFTVLEQLPRYLRILTIFIAVFLATTFVAIVGMLLFWCGSPYKNWTYEPRGMLEMDCYTILERPIYIVYVCFSLSADILLLIAGLLTLRILKLSSMRQTVGVAFITSIGILSAAASLIRALMLARYTSPASAHEVLASTTSKVYSLDPLRQFALWISVELLSAIYACSLPALRTIVGRGGALASRKTALEESGDSLRSRDWIGTIGTQNGTGEFGEELRSLTREVIHERTRAQAGGTRTLTTESAV